MFVQHGFIWDGEQLPPSPPVSAALGETDHPPSCEEVCADTPESMRPAGIIFASTVGRSLWFFAEGTALVAVLPEDDFPVEVKDNGLPGCT